MFRLQLLQPVLKRSFATTKPLTSSLKSFPTFSISIPTTTTTTKTLSVADTFHNSQSHRQHSPFKILASALGASLFFYTVSSPLFNDAAALTPGEQIQRQSKVVFPHHAPTVSESHLNNKLNYKELTLGSVTGLFIGIILGKLSQVFLFVSLSSFFLLEFLENRGIINIPWNYIVTLGKDKIDVKKLIFEKPSFYISFVLSLIVAAYNV
ncbi:uncharacterized protein LODBEIA_P06080 [Lodderomyces beijingensis]|uniref:FUN14 n=1 Tax=Lodderomyces beijingensis TaxID=1775926 RepID=A0ABP0ZDY6_9ASCO